MYPEGILLLSIYWKSASDGCAIASCIPIPLLIKNSEKYGFASIQLYIRSRLINVSSSTSSNSHYYAFFYDIMTNATVNHEDYCLILNRGLIVGIDRSSRLALRGKEDSTLLESVDNR